MYSRRALPTKECGTFTVQSIAVGDDLYGERPAYHTSRGSLLQLLAFWTGYGAYGFTIHIQDGRPNALSQASSDSVCFPPFAYLTGELWTDVKDKAEQDRALCHPCDLTLYPLLYYC